MSSTAHEYTARTLWGQTEKNDEKGMNKKNDD